MGRRLVGGVVVVAGVLVVVTAGTALAHTRFVESDPEHRAVLDAPPGEVTMEFARAVDPRLVSAVLIRADGRAEADPSVLTPDRPDATIIRFGLPLLETGTYGLQWRSVGVDGHRVAGEVVFTVAGGGAGSAERPSRPSPATDGAVALSTGPSRSQRSPETRPSLNAPEVFGGAVTSVGDRVGDAAGLVARIVWQAGLVLMVGALFTVRWLRRRRDEGLDDVDLVASVDWAGTWGARLAVAGLGLGWVLVVAVLSAAQSGGVGLTSVRVALGSPVSVVGAIAFALLLDLTGWARVKADMTRRSRLYVPVVLAVIIGARVAVGHASDAVGVAAVAARVLSGVVHAGAAALWLGPIVVAAASVVLRSRRGAGAGSASGPVRAYLGDYARTAVWVFALLMATGIAQWLLAVGLRLDLNGYGGVVALKAAFVVAVVVPLGWSHHRRYARDPRGFARRPERGLRRAGSSLRVEAAAGCVVLALGATLTAMAPQPPDAPAPQAAAVDEPRDTVDCRELVVGRPDCYRTLFASVARSEGVAAALAAIDTARDTDAFVAEQCHQVTHDLGNDVTAFLDLADALAEEGSLCASGYYHGVVESTLGNRSDQDLAENLPEVCEPAAETRYSFVHYNCVHGVGHGIMLRSGLDLFTSLADCESYVDEWEAHACWGGVFMENVVAVQQGQAAGEFRDQDPFYPCSAVTEAQKPACYSIHTGYLLWRHGWDVASVFALCEQAEAGYVDDCYQSMGRDISGFALLEPAGVIEACELGSARWRQYCYIGAALNAVYTESGTDSATALCDAVPPEHRPACERARDVLAAQL